MEHGRPIVGNPPSAPRGNGADGPARPSRPVRLPIRDLERAHALVGDKDAIRLLAGLLDTHEVATLWGVSPDFVKDLGRRGLLPRVKLGRAVRFRVLDVVKAIEQHTDARHVRPLSRSYPTQPE